MIDESTNKLIAIGQHAGFSFHTKLYNYPRTLLNTYIIRLQLAGKCKALIDGHLVPIVQGDLLMFRPGQLYQLILEKGSKDYFLFCNGSWIEQWWNTHQFPNKMVLPMDDELIYLWKYLSKEIYKLSTYTEELADSLLKVFCLHLQRLMTKDDKLDKSYRIKNYIELHAMDNFKLEDVAKHMGISVSRTVHVFKSAFDQSIMHYAIEVRLENAKGKIRFSAMSLQHIAESCGFNSYSYFHRQFLKRYGFSPKQYRNEMWHAVDSSPKQEANQNH